jgi:hypothetical protein
MQSKGPRAGGRSVRLIHVNKADQFSAAILGVEPMFKAARAMVKAFCEAGA